MTQANLTFIGPFIVIHFYSKTNLMHQSIKFILFWNDTLHVSDDFSVHHQEFRTVHTATGICQTETAVCLLACRQQLASRIRTSVLILLASCQQTCMTDTIAVCTVKNYWWWTEELFETCKILSKKRPTWCRIFYYYFIQCSTCFGC